MYSGESGQVIGRKPGAFCNGWPGGLIYHKCLDQLGRVASFGLRLAFFTRTLAIENTDGASIPDSS